jgi:sulfonate transport system substrate-binding protein
MRAVLHFIVGLAALGLAVCAGPSRALAAGPSEIRIAIPAVGVGNRPVTGGSALATVHLRGLLEDEFKPDGIKITWNFLRGAGPAVNELYANGLTDFSSLGDLPTIVGFASGLKYRALLTSSVRGNCYVAVPADSNVQTIADLRGKRVSVQKGTATHLMANKILESFGLGERDVRLINMDSPTARLAVVTGDIDASFGSSEYLGLRDQGAARIIFSTRGGDAKLTSNGLFLGAESFIRKYPEHTKRVVKTIVLAAKWLADQENAPQPVYQLWTRSGTTFSSYKEDWTGESLKYKLSPLLDQYVYARYNAQIQSSQRLGLTRRTFDFAEIAEPSFLQAVLKEQGLENFWAQRDPNTGAPLAGATVTAAR